VHAEFRCGLVRVYGKLPVSGQVINGTEFHPGSFAISLKWAGDNMLIGYIDPGKTSQQNALSSKAFTAGLARPEAAHEESLDNLGMMLAAKGWLFLWAIPIKPNKTGSRDPGTVFKSNFGKPRAPC